MLPEPPTDDPDPSAGPQATPSHFSLIPPLLAWRKDEALHRNHCLPQLPARPVLAGVLVPPGSHSLEWKLFLRAALLGFSIL